jgi:hypothetical protein
MYHAKQAGRNRVAFARPLRDMGLDSAWNPADETAREHKPEPLPVLSSPLSGHQVVLVASEPTGASLCPLMSLSVLIEALHEAAREDAPNDCTVQRTCSGSRSSAALRATIPRPRRPRPRRPGRHPRPAAPEPELTACARSRPSPGPARASVAARAWGRRRRRRR